MSSILCLSFFSGGMSDVFWLLLLIVIGLLLAFVLGYNSLSRLAQEVKQCNANIMASVQKRADLANRLMDIARSYGEHEKLTHITVYSYPNSTYLFQ